GRRAGARLPGRHRAGEPRRHRDGAGAPHKDPRHRDARTWPAAGAIRMMPTSTDKVPNTSATAASAGADLNGAAVRNACATLRERMAPVAAKLLGGVAGLGEAGPGSATPA